MSGTAITERAQVRQGGTRGFGDRPRLHVSIRRLRHRADDEAGVRMINREIDSAVDNFDSSDRVWWGQNEEHARPGAQGPAPPTAVVSSTKFGPDPRRQTTNGVTAPPICAQSCEAS